MLFFLEAFTIDPERLPSLPYTPDMAYPVDNYEGGNCPSTRESFGSFPISSFRPSDYFAHLTTRPSIRSRSPRLSLLRIRLVVSLDLPFRRYIQS